MTLIRDPSIDWIPGQLRLSAWVACCPHCGATSGVHRHVRKNPAALLSYWYCSACSGRWKSTENPTGRAVVLA